MRYVIVLFIIGILVCTSVIVYTPDAEITSKQPFSRRMDSRSGPQINESEMGGWWLQNETEDFDGGVFDDVEVDESNIWLKPGQFDPNAPLWTRFYSNEVYSLRGSRLAMAYDSINKKIVTFGGYWNSNYLDYTHIYDVINNTWSLINTGPPPARDSHKMVFDSYNGKIIMFGGYGNGYKGDTWEFDTNTERWTWITNSGPSARTGHSMVYDAANRKVVLFGGWDSNNNKEDDTWTFDPSLGSWSEVNTNGPSKRYKAGMAYDSDNKTIVLFGGRDHNNKQ